MRPQESEGASADALAELANSLAEDLRPPEAAEWRQSLAEVLWESYNRLQAEAHAAHAFNGFDWSAW